MALEKCLLSLRVHIMTSVVRQSEPDITDLGRLICKSFLLLCEKTKCEKIYPYVDVKFLTFDMNMFFLWGKFNQN